MRGTALALLAGVMAATPQATPPRSAADGDWPQWLGPFRDGRASAASGFPAAGPLRLSVAWRRPVGIGSSGLSVSGDRLVTLGSDESGSYALALSPRDGSPAWRIALDPADPADESGPGSTPALADGLAYVVSPGCLLRALDVAGGQTAWQVDLKTQFGAKPRRGCASSPLVDGERLIVQTGAADDKRIAALDRRSGAVLWVANGAGRAVYSSPGVRARGGAREILVHHADTSQGDPRSGLGALRPDDGQLAWQAALDKGWSWATPVAVGDDGVLLLTWNDAALLRAPQGAAPAAVAWRSPGFSAYVGSPVYKDGYLYGHGGDFLRCLRASDGTTVWEERTYPGSVVLAGDALVALSITAGVLRVVDASPQAYRERARLQLLEPGSRAETPASVVGRRIFARNDEEIVAVDVE